MPDNSNIVDPHVSISDWNHHMSVISTIDTVLEIVDEWDQDSVVYVLMQEVTEGDVHESLSPLKDLLREFRGEADGEYVLSSIAERFGLASRLVWTSSLHSKESIIACLTVIASDVLCYEWRLRPTEPFYSNKSILSISKGVAALYSHRNTMAKLCGEIRAAAIIRRWELKGPRKADPPQVPPDREPSPCTSPECPSSEPGGLFIDGKRISVRRGALIPRLLLELWDSGSSKPKPPRPIDEVLESIYPDDDGGDSKLKSLAYRASQMLEAKGACYSVKTLSGAIWLERSPD